MFCCAQFTEDESWYRARITESATKGTAQAQVIYVDFGNHEALPVSRLRMLRKEHAELPMMAVLCALDGAVPSGGVRMECFVVHIHCKKLNIVLIKNLFWTTWWPYGSPIVQTWLDRLGLGASLSLLYVLGRNTLLSLCLSHPWQQSNFQQRQPEKLLGLTY